MNILITGASSALVLNDIIAIMKEFPNAKFLIEGHCDGYGTVELNNKLSKARAAAVENYLQENGIADDRLSSKGFGKSNPLYTNKTREGRAGTSVYDDPSSLILTESSLKTNKDLYGVSKLKFEYMLSDELKEKNISIDFISIPLIFF